MSNLAMNPGVQVVIGILLAWGLYWLSTKIMNQDKLVIDVQNSFNVQTAVPVFTGYVDAMDLYKREFNTVNPFTQNYRNLMRSYNRKGGAQFSYSFWMFLDDVTPANVANKVILLRGDPKAYRYAVTFPVSEENPNAYTKQYPDLPPGASIENSLATIKCPLIKFGDSYDSIQIQYNTLDTIDNQVDISPRSSFFDNTMRKDLLKLIGHKWVLYTFVFEDNVAISDFEDGLVLKFYVNDIMYHVQKQKATLRQNNGNLYMFPYGGINGARFGNVNFHNYALSDNNVIELYNKGPPKDYSTDLMTSSRDLGSPLYLSEYNKLDIYNS